MSCLEPALKKKKMDRTDKASEGLPSAEELKELCSSPDPFEDSSLLDNTTHAGGGDQRDEAEEMAVEIDELQEVLSTDASPQRHENLLVNSECGGGESSSAGQGSEFIPWKGCALTDLQKGPNCYGIPQVHPIKPSSNHTVMFQVGHAKKESTNAITDAWDNDHVRMPCSSQNRYPVGDILKPRWEMVKTALKKPIKNSKELESAVKSYNLKYAQRWDFSGLHYFFNEAIEEEEAECFFAVLLPQIIQLALQLPALITRPLPLLRQHHTHSISLSQQQIACLLANAFFCTYPRRNASKQASEYSTFPDINFNRLFQGQKKKTYLQRTCEKLKCLFHYFRRVCHKPPTGNVTFTRRHISIGNFPVWERSGHFFRKLHISNKGTIEDYGRGMLQVDFANKMVGGGVLGWGCVQEEIRFVICPELIIARLFTECLDTTEALLITGCEQFSTYEGYADNFSWSGDYQDDAPHDASGRLLCSVVAIDALYLRYPAQQFTVNNLTRELNKAYVGFCNTEVIPEHLSAVATGNWGCGVYRGNTGLKALLQLMAAAQAGRALAYFTFGDAQLRDDVVQMHNFLMCHKATVGLVWRHLCKYYEQCYRHGTFVLDIFDYLYKSMDPTGYAKNNLPKGRNRAVSTSPKVNHASPRIPAPPKMISDSLVMTNSESKTKRDTSPEVDNQAALEKISVDISLEKQNLPTVHIDMDSSRSPGKNQSAAFSKSNSKPTEGEGSKNVLKNAHAVHPVHPVPSQVKLHPNPLNATRERTVNTNKADSSPVHPPKSAKPKTSKPALNVKDPAGSSSTSLVDWLNQYEKKDPQTIQKRISDYFYEINVPK